MKTPRNQIAQLIADKALEKGASTKKLADEVAAYLLTEHRSAELASILRDIQADWAEAGHVEVIATSKHQLSGDAKKDIRDRISRIYPNAKTIIVNEVIDPTIRGGVRLNLANQQLDLSVEAKLNKFKQLTTAGKE